MIRSNPQTADSVNFKQKYLALKKKLKVLVYEQECFVDELRKSQRKLLKVTRDRSFLLDRLLQYEQIDASSSDTDSTASSDSGHEAVRDVGMVKKKRTSTVHQPVATITSASTPTVHFPVALSSAGDASIGVTSRPSKEPAKKRPKVVKKVSTKSNVSKAHSLSGLSVTGPGNGLVSDCTSLQIPDSGLLSREEIERHLDLKHSSKPQFLSIDMTTPHSLPDDIFCHDNSNQDCPDIPLVKVENDDSDLIIDMT
jgi:hypothetical protein